MTAATDLFDDLPPATGNLSTGVVSADDIDPTDLARLFQLADRCRTLVDRRGGADILAHRVMAALFYEPSTRTASSFIAAMERLGGSTIPLLQGPSATSAAKGESLRDTARTLSQYADALVLRHPEPGAARGAADAATIPVFNAGDGSNEHPTQALLDVYTMRDQLGDLDGRTVLLCGDLKYGRTIHSLVRLLRHYDIDLRCIRPDALRLPDALLDHAAEHDIPVESSEQLRPALSGADVVYMTRIQRERFDDPATYERYEGSYKIDTTTMEDLEADAILMHPLPRVGEISPEVDDDARAVYFEQARNGMYVRMALLADAIG